VERDGTYKSVYSYTVLGQTFSGEDTGKWEFGDNETIVITSDNNGSSTATITRLTNSEFWTKETDSSTGDVTEVHYKSK
jgi:hypothetical protein